jgi:hypothetical protein
MPTQYTTGTINQPDSAQVSLAMINKLRDDVVAHAAWDLVEEFTPASGAVRWYVFKCLAAQSGLPYDFYVVVGRTLASGELRLAVCESYDAPSHTMSFFSPTGSSSTFLYDASGRRTELYTLATVVFPSGSTFPLYHTWIPSGTSTKWWIIVADDSFTVAFNGPSNGFFGAGAYVPLSAVPITFPVMSYGLTSSFGATTGGITRNPSVAGSTSPGYGLMYDRVSAFLGFRGDLRYNDRLQSNQRPVAEVGLSMYTGSADWPAQYGYALGKLKRVRSGSNAAAGFAFGDAYAMGGTLWVPYLPTDSLIWDTGVASS